MPVVKLESAFLGFGHVPLMNHVDFQIDPGERVCLVGRNGEGKSTLLKVLQGVVPLDSGGVWRQPSLRMGFLEQDVKIAEGETVYDVVAGGLAEAGRLLAEYHHLVVDPETYTDERKSVHIGELQMAIDACNGWTLETRVATTLSRLDLQPDVEAATLSGGYTRRVMLARALVSDPDLLLLDEPTNHLDITSIDWLEEMLLGFKGAVLFITHDRSFLRRLATRIVELDRGKLTSWPSNYDEYLVKREERFTIEDKQSALFDKRLAQEEVWIRQGVKARRTRNEGRVRALYALREERQARREQTGRVAMNLDRGDSSGKIVVEAENVTKTFGDRTIVRNFSTRILRGDRIGIIGPNGAGKSTLIKLLLGDLVPDSGKITVGTKLQVAYFDQQRATLNPERTVAQNLSDRGDTILVNGQSRHIISYLQDFLFAPARVNSPVKSLSGGERNRLLLARLFMQPANLLIMDEPTNDLDVETLELLEELLGNYDGTLLVVSHDRAFLDNVVTSTLVFEGNGKVDEFVGGYQDWLRQRAVPRVAPPVATKKAAGGAPVAQASKRKLNYKEQRELDGMPGVIEDLEAQQAKVQKRAGHPDFYKSSKEDVTRTLAEMETLAKQLDVAYKRWDELSK